MLTHLLTILEPFSFGMSQFLNVLSELLCLEITLGAVNLEGAVRVIEVTQSEEACIIPILFTKTDVYESPLSISCKTKRTAGESG